MPEQMYRHEGSNASTSALTNEDWWNNCIYNEAPTGVYVETQQLNCVGPPPAVSSSKVPEFDWATYPDVINVEQPLHPQVYQQRVPTQQEIRKSLLKLKAELLHDLDLLDDGSYGFTPPYHAQDSCNPSMETLNLPITQLFHHSSWLLEIVHSFRGTSNTSDDESGLALSTQLYPTQNCHFEGSISNNSDSGESGLEESAAISSPTDSGYQTRITSPGQTTLPSYDVTLWLSVLEAHCYLARIYRAIFTRLYQLFLIIPPNEADGFLLLPALRHGPTQLDGNFTKQVKTLVEIGSTMMGEIVVALRWCSDYDQAHVDGEFSVLERTSENSWTTSIRECVLAQEQDPCEMPLVDIMKCLRQLLRDTVVP
ncbi:unnamed protein product [Penicillium salamii]|nr:unnamed protein product [Penicillium salamii]CAG8306209.1 unnamed protein product [Penicillium salamii]CAG8419524.1 unnamed protein product [Penicillium salamii]